MKLKRPFLSTALWTALGRLGGLMIPFCIAMIFGATPETDAFFFAYSVIFALLNVFGHVFESALVPHLARRKAEPEEVNRLAGDILRTCLPLAAGISLAIAAGLGPGLQVWGGLEAHGAHLTGRLFLEMTPGFLLAILVAHHHSFFCVYKQFWFAALSPLIRACVMLAAVFLFHKPFGIHALSLGFSAGEILRWMAAYGLMRRLTPARLLFPGPGSTAHAGFFLREAGFQILALFAVNLAPLADQWFAAPLGGGSLSLLNYADRLLQIPYLLFINGLLQVFLSFWSDDYHVSAPEDFARRIRRDARVVLLAAFVLGGILWLLRTPLIELIFTRSGLALAQRDLLAGIFGWLALALIPGMIRLFYARVLFVVNRSRFYALQAWAEFLCKVALNYFLCLRYGIMGIAMATLINYGFASVWLHVALDGFLRSHSRQVPS